MNKLNVSLKILDEIPDDAILYYSGGIDSTVLKYIIKKYGYSFKSIYIKTSLESQKLLDYIKTEHPDTIFYNPKTTFENIVEKYRYLPTISNPYCCSFLWTKSDKELNSQYKNIIYGVIKDDYESKDGYKVKSGSNSTAWSPLYQWTKEEIKAFADENNINYSFEYKTEVKRNRAWSCPFCPIVDIENKMLNIELYPDAYEKIKNLAYQCYENNKALQKTYSSAEEYLDAYMNTDCKNLNLGFRKKITLDNYPEYPYGIRKLLL